MSVNFKFSLDFINGIKKKEEIEFELINEIIFNESDLTLNFVEKILPDEKWDDKPPKINSILKDHDTVILLAFLKKIVVKQRKQTRFISNLSSIGAPLPFITILINWIENKSILDSLDLYIVKLGFDTYLKNRTHLASLMSGPTINLPIFITVDDSGGDEEKDDLDKGEDDDLGGDKKGNKDEDEDEDEDEYEIIKIENESSKIEEFEITATTTTTTTTTTFEYNLNSELFKIKNDPEINLYKNIPLEWIIYPPSLLWVKAKAPCLTVNESGQLAIYTGKPKSDDANKKIYLFDGFGCEKEINVDILMKNFTQSGVEIPDMNDFSNIEEIVVVCVDTSRSMLEPLKPITLPAFVPLTTDIDEKSVANLMEKYIHTISSLNKSDAIWLIGQLLTNTFYSHSFSVIENAAKKYFNNVIFVEKKNTKNEKEKKNEEKEKEKKNGGETEKTEKTEEKDYFFCHDNQIIVTRDKNIEKAQSKFLDKNIQKTGLYYYLDFRKTGIYHVVSKPEKICKIIVVDGYNFESRKCVIHIENWKPCIDFYLQVAASFDVKNYFLESKYIKLYYNNEQIDGQWFGQYLYPDYTSIGDILEHFKNNNQKIKFVIECQHVYPDREYINKKNTLKNQQLSKIELAKLMFNCYVDRVSAYDLPCALGLVQFNEQVEQLVDIQPSIELFRDAVENLNSQGNTALYDAIIHASKMIEELENKKKTSINNVSKRIIVLTDGKDTCSKSTLSQVQQMTILNNIYLDVIFLGNGINRVCGQHFTLNNEQDALGLAEMEPFLSIKMRKEARITKIINISNSETIPLVGDIYNPNTSGPTDPIVIKSIMSDFKLAKENQGYIINLVDDSKLNHWIINFIGPRDTIYEGGIFKMNLILEDDFPQNAPKCRFYLPSVLHVNISHHGRVCHSVLDRNWTSKTSIKLVLDCIYGLFLAPEPSDPLNSILASLLLTNRQEYETLVRSSVKKNICF